MIRTQIQLTEEQAHTLKEMAHKQSISMAELIRRSIDNYIEISHQPTMEEKKKRALSAVGVVSSGVRDLATNHDKYLAEVYGDFGNESVG